MKLLLATTTGFDRVLTTQVLTHLGWQHYFVASITSDDVADGRPAPYMLFRAMEAAHVNDVRGCWQSATRRWTCRPQTMPGWGRRSGCGRALRQKSACGKNATAASYPASRLCRT